MLAIKGRVPLSAVAFALVFATAAMAMGYNEIGLPPVIIVGGSAIVGLVLWLWTYQHGPLPARAVLPPFLVTVACLEGHMIEEYFAGFAPAMSRLFDISWTQEGFLLVFSFVGPVIYSLTALGLYRRSYLAGFFAWFIFIGPGVAEFTHFIFPMLKPALDPGDLRPLSTVVSNGHYISNMPNYYFWTTGRYYFPGMYTAIMPMIPGIYGIAAAIRARRKPEPR